MPAVFEFRRIQLAPLVPNRHRFSRRVARSGRVFTARTSHVIASQEPFNYLRVAAVLRTWTTGYLNFWFHLNLNPILRSCERHRFCLVMVEPFSTLRIGTLLQVDDTLGSNALSSSALHPSTPLRSCRKTYSVMCRAIGFAAFVASHANPRNTEAVVLRSSSPSQFLPVQPMTPKITSAPGFLSAVEMR